jgi:hypothetical protein
MNRRSFLSILGLAPLAIAIPAPRKTYSFLGSIFRRQDYPFWVGERGFDDLQEAVNAVPEAGTVRIRTGTFVLSKQIFVPASFKGAALLHPEGNVVINGCHFQYLQEMPHVPPILEPSNG